MNSESNSQFEGRKADHIRISLSDYAQARGLSGLDLIQLTHEALPEIDFDDVDLSTAVFGHALRAPFLISSMTAGHAESLALNARLVRLAAARGWCMGVGSQRRELNDPAAAAEWATIRRESPGALLFANLGLAQLIRTPLDQIKRLCDGLKAIGIFIHLNALQECIQPEGTPRFRGGLASLTKLCRALDIPVIVKETGCGISRATFARLAETGVRAVDVSGLGGTHWGRVEGGRAVDVDAIRAHTAATFANWGIPTVRAVRDGTEARGNFEIWASGGVRSGLDAAKLLALGSSLVGLAQPLLVAALKDDDELNRVMATFEYELRTAMFCTGSANVSDLRSKRVWTWTTT